MTNASPRIAGWSAWAAGRETIRAGQSANSVRRNSASASASSRALGSSN